MIKSRSNFVGSLSEVDFSIKKSLLLKSSCFRLTAFVSESYSEALASFQASSLKVFFLAASSLSLTEGLMRLMPFKFGKHYFHI